MGSVKVSGRHTVAPEEHLHRNTGTHAGQTQGSHSLAKPTHKINPHSTSKGETSLPSRRWLRGHRCAETDGRATARVKGSTGTARPLKEWHPRHPIHTAARGRAGLEVGDTASLSDVPATLLATREADAAATRVWEGAFQF